MAANTIGPYRLRYAGDYSESTPYSLNQWVTDSGNSYAYINPNPSTGAALNDTDHWVCFAQKGDQGNQDIVDAAESHRNAAALSASTATAQAILAQGYKDDAAASAAQLAAGTASPAGTYANLAALIAANPNHSKIYVTTDNGHWNYFNGSAFVSGGVYQAASVAADIDNLTTQLADIVPQVKDAVRDLGIKERASIAITSAEIYKFINTFGALISSATAYAYSLPIPVFYGNKYEFTATGTTNISAISSCAADGTNIKVITAFSKFTQETIDYVPTADGYIVLSYSTLETYTLMCAEPGLLKESVDRLNAPDNYVERIIHNTYHSHSGYFNYTTKEYDDTPLFKYKVVDVNPTENVFLKYDYTIESAVTQLRVALFLDENDDIVGDNLSYATAGHFSGTLAIPSAAIKCILGMRSTNTTYYFALLKKHFGNSFDTVSDMVSSGSTKENRVGGYMFRNVTDNPALLKHTQHAFSDAYYDANSSVKQYECINTNRECTESYILNRLEQYEVDFTPDDDGFTRIIVGKNMDDLFFVSYETSQREGTPGGETDMHLEVTSDFITFTPVWKSYLSDLDCAYVDGVTNIKVRSVKQFANGSYIVGATCSYPDDPYATGFFLLSKDFETITQIYYTDPEDAVVMMRDEFAGNVYDWHMDVKGSRCIATTYGTRDPETDRGRVWYTEDNGSNWKQIFQMTTHYQDGVDVGDPEVTRTHIHGVMIDQHDNRLFVIAGEGNQNLFWTDKGYSATNSDWNVISIRRQMSINQQNAVQVVNGYAFKYGIILGSDNANIGCLYRINKLDGKEYSNLEIAHEFIPNHFPNDTFYCAAEISRRDQNAPLLYCETREQCMTTEEDNEVLNELYKGRVVATYDGINFTEVWQDDTYGAHDVMLDGVKTTRNYSYCTRGMNCYLLNNGDAVIKYAGREHYFFGGLPLYITGYSNGPCKVRIIKRAEKYL